MAGLIDTDSGLEFGTGLVWLAGGIGQAGLVITSSTSGAALFLAEWGPYGMAMDFTDASIAIDDSTGVLDYNSQGTVSSTTGLPLGPLSKLTYSAPSVKLTEQADGYLSFQAHNYALRSDTPANWTASGTGLTDTNLFTENGATSSHHVILPIGTTGITGATYVLTVEVKPEGGLQWVRIQGDGYSGHLGVASSFDLVNGVVGTKHASITATSISPVSADGYYTCTLEIVATGSSVGPIIALATTDGTGTTSYAGNSTRAARIRKWHLRRTPSVSTYVATTSAAVYDLPYVYSSGVKTGIMVEPAATNLCLRSNDFTNASWTKSNMTTALTATGPDNVANSASTLTATAGNATALQAITSGSSSRVTSTYIKRRTGSGNIDLTQDNGSTWTTQTVTSSWTRVSLAAVTSTNPTVGIRIVTSGDEVDVYCFDHETGTVVTSGIITYGAAVTRAVDTDTSLLNLFPSLGSAYTAYIRYKPASASVATTALRLDDTTANELVSIGNNASGQGIVTVTDGGVPDATTSGTITSSAFHRIAVSAEANNVLLVVNGGAAAQDTGVTLPTLTRMLLGNTSGQLVTQIALFPGARTEAQLQAIGA